MIAAISKNNQIGLNQQMPWHLPEDLNYFRCITTGHPIIMGRKTYESIGRLLPDRHNIILTRDPNFSISHDAIRLDIVHSLQEALSILPDEPATFIIGGGEIYAAFMPYATRLYLTLIDQEIEGDTAFPAYKEDFRCIQSTSGNTTTQNGSPIAFTVWQRK